jgi:hypothetical protein
LRWRVLPNSFLIDWANRYGSHGESNKEWRLPIQVENWIRPSVIAHYAELQKALDAKPL